MKLLKTFFRLAAGLFVVVNILTALGLVAGRELPYMGELAYMETPSGFSELYLMDVQRLFRIRLQRTFVNDCCLTWSPDGRKLTFVRDMSSDGSTDLFSMDFHSPTRRLTDARGADLYPMYSPDGGQIAYTAYGYGNPEIYLMNSDGTEKHSLTQNSFITNINPHPVWSADGKSVLFSDFANLDSLLSVPQNCADPCHDATQMLFNTNGLPLMTTSFIPLDQSRIFMAAFERTKNGGYGVYGLDSHTSNKPERLTINAGLASPAMVAYQNWIAFVSGTTNLSQRVEDANLFVMDTNCIGSANGCIGTLQQVATQIRAEDNLSWSTDGRWLAYVTITGNTSKLNLLDTTCIWEHRDCTDYTRQLPISSSRYIRPVWRPALQ